VEKELFDAGEGHPAYMEGLQNGDWVVLDYIHVMVHLFVPGLREKYQLERLWSQGKVLDLALEIPPQTTDAYL